MPDTQVAAPPAAAEAQPSSTFDTAQLDAILEKMRPMPKMDPPAAPTPEKTPEEASKWTEASAANLEPETEKAPAEPEKPAVEPEPAAPASPFDPPPSVLGELLEKSEAPKTIEDEFGTIPEKPDKGFKSKEEEVNWGNIRASHQKALAEVTRLREESKKKPLPDEGMAAQLADLTARNAELNAIVERSAIESHPFVRQQFDEPRKQLFNIAAGALKKVEIDPSRLGKILSLEGKDRVDAMDELYGEIESPTTRDKVTNAIAQIDMLEEKKADFLSDRQGNVERLTAAEKAEQYRQFAAQEKVVDDSITEAIDLLANKIGFEHWRKSEDPNATEWNGRIAERERVLKFLSKENKDPKLLVRVLAAGVVAEDVRKWAGSLQQQLAEANKKLSEYEGAIPNLNGSSATEKADSAGTLAKDADEMAAAGILPTDSLAVQSRKLGALWNRNGR
jgi:hypothetical protein